MEGRLKQLEQEHEAKLEAVLREAEAATAEAAKAATAEAEAQLKAEHDAALGGEREAASARMASLSTEVDALSGVLSHDTQYKKVSHATHQLTATVLTVRASLSGKVAAAAAALGSLPTLAVKVRTGARPRPSLTIAEPAPLRIPRPTWPPPALPLSVNRK